MDNSFFIKQNRRENARRFIYQFITVLKSSRLYPDSYQPLLESIKNLYDILIGVLGHEKEVTFNIIGEEIVFINIPLIPLVRDEVLFRNFIDEIREKNITSICFMEGIKEWELQKFIKLMSLNPKELIGRGGLMQVLAEENIVSITVHRVIIAAASEQKRELLKSLFSHEKREKGRKIFFEGIETIKKVMDEVKLGEKVHIKDVQKVIHLMIDSIFLDKAVLQGLTTIKNYDEYTYNHSVNVAIFSLALGSELSLNRTQLNSLGVAAMMHDVGKVRIPARITQKPGTLNDEEWKIVKNHPVDGVKILSDMGDIDSLAMTVAFEHHMGYDLSGYPKIQKARDLHIFSRIVCIADFYDATTTFRIYHKPLMPDRSVGLIIKQSGSYFDPLFAKVFVNMIGVFPIGTFVKLNTGELAIVYRINKDNLLRPQVVVVEQDDSRSEEDIDNASMRDLTERDENTSNFKHTIVETLDPLQYNVDVTKFF
ncbi:MAG: HD-GYP domain-containing protein [bacterium]